MNIKIFGCEKFHRLSCESADRELSPKEAAFLDKHRMVCIDCVRYEDQAAVALSVLRSVVMEADVNPLFEERVMRRLRVSRAHDSLRYWSPALVGAGIACVAIFSALQIATVTHALPGLSSKTGESRLIHPSSDALPRLLLERSRASSSSDFGVRQ